MGQLQQSLTLKHMQKSYTLDLTNYTEEDILFVARYHGYGEFSSPDIGPLEYIEQKFKTMADDWFAKALIAKRTAEIDQQKNQILNEIIRQVSTNTSIQ